MRIDIAKSTSKETIPVAFSVNLVAISVNLGNLGESEQLLV